MYVRRTQKQAAGADRQRQTGKHPNEQRRGDNAHGESLDVKTQKSRNLAPYRSSTEAEMADVALSGVERRDKSTESPAKYAGNEDGEKSDEDRGKRRSSNFALSIFGF